MTTKVEVAVYTISNGMHVTSNLSSTKTNLVTAVNPILGMKPIQVVDKQRTKYKNKNPEKEGRITEEQNEVWVIGLWINVGSTQES